MLNNSLLLQAVHTALPYFFDDPKANYQWRMEVREQLAMALDKARPIHIEDYNDFVLYDAVFNAYSYLIEDPNDHHLENRFKVRLQLEEALGENYL